MDENNKKAYNAIKNFVISLHEVFGENKPLALYNKLIAKTSSDKAMLKHIKSFTLYLGRNKSKILANMDLKKSDVIKYDNSDGVFIDLPLFISKSDKETLNVIKAHLITLISIFFPNEKLPPTSSSSRGDNSGINPMSFIQDNLDTSTKEGKFMNDTLKNITENLDFSEMDMSNPMSLITNLMSSGVGSDLMKNMGENFDGEGFNQEVMFNTMKNLMSGITKQIDPESRLKVKTLINSFSSLLDEPQSIGDVKSVKGGNSVVEDIIKESGISPIENSLDVSQSEEKSTIEEVSQHNESVMERLENN